MSILLTCSCGKQLRVADEYAGRSVKCPTCGAVHTVASAVTPKAPPAAVIRFACECGKQMQAKAEHAGRTTRCPACEAPVVIPGGEGETAAGIQADQPARRKAPPPDLDDDDRPVRKARGRKPRKVWPWVAGAVAVLLLVGGGITAWLLLSGRIAEDLALVPGDAQGFVTVRVADVWKNDDIQKAINQIKQQLPEAGDLEALAKNELGLGPADVERLTFVVGDVSQQAVWGIVSTTSPYDRAALLSKLTPNAREVTHAGKSYHVGVKKGAPLALHFVNDRTFLIGPEPGIKYALPKLGKHVAGPLDDALKLASKKHHFAAGMVMPAELKQAASKLPAQYQELLDIRTATLVMDLGKTLDVELTVNYTSSDKAKKAKETLDEAMKAAKLLVDTFANQLTGPGAPPEGAQIAQQVRDSLNSVKTDRSGSTVSVSASTSLGGTALATGLFVPAVQKVRQAAGRAASTNNLKQLVLAMHNYNDVYMHLPSANIYSRNDPRKPLYSWRVALLPFIEQDKLYKQFHLDEPWDSPHNKTLIPLMPKTYAVPGKENPNGLTYYKVFTGPRTPFNNPFPPRIPATFADGTSNTILIVESSQPVTWTKPEDIPYTSARQARFQLGGGFNCALADGSVRFIPPTMSDRTLDLAICPNDGEVMPRDW